MTSKPLLFAKELAKEAGSIMNEYFASDKLGLTIKEDTSPLTVADTKINRLVIKRIQEAFPKDSILGEEESYLQPDSEYTWVCDPIDGTKPFSLEIPTSMFSLARTQNGEVIVAVAYDPFFDRLFSAQKGEGAFMNEKKLSVNTHASLLQSNMGLNASSRFSYMAEVNKQIALQKASIFNLQSAVYMSCLVARGAFSGYIFHLSSPWDAAAVKLIVEEAGGTVTSLSGKNQRYDKEIDGFIASNGRIHSKLVEIVNSVR